jgi:hypothetical protein
MKKLALTILFYSLVLCSKSQPWRKLPGVSLNGDVYAIINFGGYVWVSGNFSVSGNNFIIRHDGVQWISTVTTNGVPFGFCIHNNELYALGGFDVSSIHYGIMKWNGSGWNPMAQLSLGGYIQTATSYNGDLVVGGRFTSLDGVPIDYIGKWNGSVWSELCVGSMENSAAVPEVRVLYSAKGFLYAGGAFTKICGVNTSCAAKWNGSAWTALPVGGVVTSYILYGTDVVASGNFTAAGPALSHSVAKEDTVAVGDWLKISPADAGVKMDATSLAVWSGRLYIAGSYALGGGADIGNCGYWNGTTWISDHQGFNSPVTILTMYVDPVTNILYAGGQFNTQIGDTANYIAYKSLSALPIELGSFEAGCDTHENCVRLKWKTFSEHDNIGFWVERSYDGKEFSKITFISGAGTTNEVQNYEFCDYDFSSPLSYYRLAQVDYSGECNYSKMIVAHCFPREEQSTSVVVDFLDLHSSCHYEIWNMVGQMIQTGDTSHISFEKCTPGIYILRTGKGSVVESKKILKY